MWKFSQYRFIPEMFMGSYFDIDWTAWVIYLNPILVFKSSVIQEGSRKNNTWDKWPGTQLELQILKAKASVKSCEENPEVEIYLHKTFIS